MVYAVADHIVSPLGWNTSENFAAALSGKTGISLVDDPFLYPESVQLARIKREPFRTHMIDGNFKFLEQLFIFSIQSLLQSVKDFDKSKTVLVISTTKGNIDLLEGKNDFPENRVELAVMAKVINDFFGLPHDAVVVSNACVSGVSAILTAQKLIEMGLYDHAIVAGGDLITEFVISGFHAFKAISPKQCRPYDTARDGITLGEGCGSIFISRDEHMGREKFTATKIFGGGQSNDANHISGPSRTGDGLIAAIQTAIRSTGISRDQIAMINAHGTATLFNDEMESIAFNTLGLHHLPLNSLKAYFGHTLGAAGIIESIMTMHQLKDSTILATRGFQNSGVSMPLNVVSENQTLHNPQLALKTISGFGGCNAAIIFGI